ncbi:MAG: asparagine synthase (glutamine-hydrolyzing) [Verrucomicrobiales bacterium]|nr:asparagine synthase (glutamine-hydrolyzing) [Verrucomicrobiales bacterium]
MIQKKSPASADRALSMLHTLLHRGPDGKAVWLDPQKRASLAHARLSIVDLNGGTQPMHESCHQITVVFNGEIYGFEKIREELTQKGYRFRTLCDTEVLIALYLQYGIEFVDRLEGEFAFVLFDGRNGKTLIARDRFGVKPLYYSIQADLFLFGSEIKALLAHPMVERRLDPEMVYRRIHGVFLPDETMFAGIKQISPGFSMCIDSHGNITQRRHAKLDPELAGTWKGTRQQAEEAFEDSFAKAVRERLHGDVDIGLYLSGGVDSNLVAAAMRDQSSADHTAYTIDFDTPPYGEAEQAAFTAKKFDFAHQVEPLGTSDLDAHFIRSIWHAETFTANTHGTAKLTLSARASQDIKVILAGEGADEIHGGYAQFRHAALLSVTQNKANRLALKEFLSYNGAEDGVMSLANTRRRNRLAQSSDLGIPYSAQRAEILELLLIGAVNPDLKKSAQTNVSRQLLDWLDLYEPNARKLDDMTLSRFTTSVTDLPNYNLNFLGDRMEMGNHIEGRLPFLDKRVVDTLWQMPNHYHIDGDQTKTLIRSALAKTLPKQVCNRYKRIFTAPRNTAHGIFHGELAKQWLSREATVNAGVFRPNSLQSILHLYRLLPKHLQLCRLLENFLMIAISVNLVHELFIENFDTHLQNFALSPDKVPFQTVKQ